MLWIIVFFTCLEISTLASADARVKSSSSSPSATSTAAKRHLDDDSFDNDLDNSRRVETIRGVAGRNVSLPCDILQQPLAPNDAVTMLLWFKEPSGEPLYSYDARKGRAKRGNSAHHLGTGSTSKSGPPPKLLIQNLRESDEGVYRCRVDFRNSPTKNAMVNLSVILPPSIPKIYDMKRRDMSNLRIVYADEGANLTLVCESHGGRPKPRVVWYLGSQLINSSYEVREIQTTNGEINFVTVNHVTLEGLTRNHHNTNLTCRASNTNLTRPASATVTIELYMRPLSVHIDRQSKRRQISAGKTYEITCRSTGSMPPAVFTWWKGSKQLKTGITANESNVSYLEWVPSPEDDGKYLACRAENPHLPEAAIEDRWNFTVRYAPIVVLRMGLSLNPKSIKERDDVYFECNVRANPAASKLTWFHEGIKLHHNITSGIVLSDHSLVLQSITRKAAGKYSCLAGNNEGRSTSNLVHLEVMFAPICKKVVNSGGGWRSQNATPPPFNVPEQLHGALKHETVSLTCEVEASPTLVTFRWTFNSSGDLEDIPATDYTSEGTISRLNYTPSTDMDYGTIGCWASNRVGKIQQPCLYQVVAAGPPYPLQNCTAYNNSGASIRISCVEGFDGGLPQKFVAVMNEHRWESSTPYWELEIRNPTSVALYAVNSKGSSIPVTIDGRAFKGVAKFTGESAPVSSVDMSPILIGLGGTATGLGLIVTGVLMALWRRHATATPSKPKQPQQPIIATFTTKGDEEDGNPDLIPTTDLTNHSTDKKLSVYGSLPRRPCHLEGREMPHEVLENPDYPRASPNNFYSLQRPHRYSETIVRAPAIQESCI
ncbi:hemicentin-2-like [Venturia canescens]|uniref:hemicentin-2-like n=1 Tax=Venturia canescens TaxID=32260 RepID=UPI001C9CCD8A|nr:hemicentin-2-like [Venturia canescens]